MKYFDKFCIENSLKGLQSLLFYRLYIHLIALPWASMFGTSIINVLQRC